MDNFEKPWIKNPKMERHKIVDVVGFLLLIGLIGFFSALFTGDPRLPFRVEPVFSHEAEIYARKSQLPSSSVVPTSSLIVVSGVSSISGVQSTSGHNSKMRE